MSNPVIDQIQVGTTTYDIKPASDYADTDTKVKQTAKSSGELPLLLASATTANSAGEAYYNPGLKYDTSTERLTVGDITSAYINIHPENSPALIPFIHNDIAFIEALGGSVSMYKVASSTDMTLLTLPHLTAYKPATYGNCFDASPSYMNMTGFTKADTATSFIIDLTLPRVFSYSNRFYIDFGSTTWRAANIKVLVSHTNMTNYVQKASVTGLVLGHYKTSISHSFTASGATSVTYGFNKLRIVLTNFQNASPRIAQIGLYNYGSQGTRYTTMSRGIDDYVWRSITPNKDITYNLGASTKRWKNTYTNNIVATNITATALKATSSADQANTKYFATNGTIQYLHDLNIKTNGSQIATYNGSSDVTVDISTLDTVTATVAAAANGTTPSVTVSTVTASDGKRNATFAFTLPNAKNGTGIGTVTATASKLSSSSSPTVTVSQVTSGLNTNCTFAFGIPQGAKGDPGLPGPPGSGIGTVTATVESVASSTAPSVTVTTAASGSDKNVTMAFKLPKGDTGVVSVVTEGIGDAVMSGSYDSSTKTVTLTKGNTFSSVNYFTGKVFVSGTNANLNIVNSSASNAIYADSTGIKIRTMSGNTATEKIILTSSGTGSFTSSVSAARFVKTGGTASQFLKADGSVDSNNYLTSTYLNGHVPALATRIPNNANLNSYTTPGFYYSPMFSVSQTLTNTPTSRPFSLVCLLDANLVNQELTTYGRNNSSGDSVQIQKWVRGGYKESDNTINWSAWVQILNLTESDARYLRLSGGTLTGNLTAPAFYESSDIRKKNIIGDISLDKCYDLLDKCQEIIYTLKGDSKEQIGVIAQEVEEFFPEIIHTDADGFKSVDYSRLVVICLKVIKDIVKRLEKIENYER